MIAGSGGFTARLGQARSARFDAWAALAGTAVAPSVGAVPITPNAGEGDDDDDGEGQGGGE